MARKTPLCTCKDWWDPIVLVLALVHLATECHASIPTAYVNLSSAIDSKSGWSLSPTFPLIPEDTYPYTVVFVNTYSLGSIQIVSSDFDVPEDSWMKVYDGEVLEEDTPVYVYPRGSRPVFQSRGHVLSLVMKSGPHVWTAHRGWRMEYTFVNYQRDSWHLKGMPRIGPCPTLLKNEGRVRMTSFRQNGQDLPMDCSWILHPHDTSGKMYIKIKEITITPGSAVSLEFRQDHSQGALMTSLPTAGYILSHDAIFVRLNGTLAQSVVDFTFSDDPSRSTHSMHTFENFTTGSCPYKENALAPRCVDYWDTQDNVDGSCDLFLPLYADDPEFNPQCPDLDRCYGRSDLCDGFSDCLYIDEVDCEEDSGNKALAWTQWFCGLGILLFFLCGGHVRYGRNHGNSCQSWREGVWRLCRSFVHLFRRAKHFLRQCACWFCCYSRSTATRETNNNATSENTEDDTAEQEEPEVPVIMVCRITTSLSGVDNPVAQPPPYDHVAIEPPPYPGGGDTMEPPPPAFSGNEPVQSQTIAEPPPPYDPTWDSNPEDLTMAHPPTYEEALNNDVQPQSPTA